MNEPFIQVAKVEGGRFGRQPLPPSFHRILFSQGMIHLRREEQRDEYSGPVLLFFGADTHYTIDLPPGVTGFVAVFSTVFFPAVLLETWTSRHLFGNQVRPIYLGDDEVGVQVGTIFLNMMKETQSNYVFKEDSLRNYFAQLIHVALKSECLPKRGSA